MLGPMIKEIKTEDGLIVLWFDEFYIEKRSKGLLKKEIEKQEVNRKIKELYPTAVLEYEINGAPIIRNTSYSFISISHYGGWYALYFSTKASGIDIQTFKNTLLKGKYYFLNFKDEKLPLTHSNLHLIWSAKEAYYKMKRGDIQDLKNEVSILDINLKSEKICLEYEGLTEFLNFSILKDIVLVWT